MKVIEKLTEHLQGNWRRYVQPELSNRSTLILHRFDGLWVAFEKSAYFLYEACPDAMLMVVQVDDNPFPLIASIVQADRLALDPALVQYQSGSPGCRRYRSTLQLTAYPEWLNAKIRDSKEYGSNNCYFEIRQGVGIRAV